MYLVIYANNEDIRATIVGKQTYGNISDAANVMITDIKKEMSAILVLEKKIELYNKYIKDANDAKTLNLAGQILADEDIFVEKCMVYDNPYAGIIIHDGVRHCWTLTEI